jgi:hypothetical protein
MKLKVEEIGQAAITVYNNNRAMTLCMVSLIVHPYALRP